MREILRMSVMTLVGRVAAASVAALTICGMSGFEAQAATRFAILSDVHVVPGNANEQKLREAVAEINATADVDYVVMNGDLSNEGSDEQLVNVKGILDAIKAPLLAIPGNHENNWSQSAGQTFVKLWGNDRFVMANDTLVVTGVNCGPYMKMGDGHIKQEDLHWLRSVLEEHRGKRVVSFCHYPLNEDLDNCPDYAAILRDYPTIIHVNGHYHVNKPYDCEGIPCMMVRSLDKKNGDYGYTLMDVTPDSVIFSQKRLGLAPERLHAYSIADALGAQRAAGSVKRGELPEGVRTTKIWTDSASIFTRLGFDAHNIYFGNSLGYVKAIDKLTGEQRWTLALGAPVFSRVVAPPAGVLAVAGADAKVRAVGARDGRVYGSHVGRGPYVADGLLAGSRFYQGGNKSMECFDAYSGSLVWRYDSIGNYCQAAPVVDGDDLIFGAWDSYLYCLDARDGHLKWRWNNGKSANMLGPGNVVPVVTPDRVIIVAPDRYMTAIDRRTGQTIWRDKSHKYRESLGRSADGTRAYAKTMDGELVAVDITAPIFKELWTLDMGLGYEHAPCVVAESDGVVYAGSRRGVVVAVSPEGKLLWSEKIGVSEVNGIDIDPTDGAVYCSLIEGTVHRLNSRK